MADSPASLARAWRDGRAAVRPRIVAAGIVGATLAVYANSFPGIFVFDDAASVLENPSIRRLWPLGPALSPPAASGVGGRPVANLTFALNHAVSGLHVAGFHAFNLALHIATALLLFGIVRRTLWRAAFPTRVAGAVTPLAGLIACVWAIHPLATSAVNYVAQRTELLMACFYLLTLYSFLRRVESGSRPWAGMGVLACTLGMASKEVMVTAPLLVLLYDRTFVSGSFRLALQRHGRIHASLAATWCVWAWLVATSQLSGRGVGYGLGVTWLEYAFTQSRAVLLYFRLSVWPHPLVFDYGWTFVRGAAAAAPYLIVALGSVGLAVFALRRHRLLGFAACATLLLLAPTSSFIPIIQQPLAENRFYLPLAVIVAAMVTAAFGYLGPRTWTLGAAALIGLAALTVQRNADYRSEVALWSDTVRKRPDNARGHSNLSAALLRAEEFPSAVVAARAAVALHPGYSDAHHNLGVGLARLGQTDEALAHYALALRGNEGAAATHRNFGDALLAAGRNANAIEQYALALRRDPGDAGAHNNLSVVRLQRGEVALAIEHSRTAVRLQPNDADGWYNLGNALAQSGEIAAATGAFDTALQLRPGFAKGYNNRGVMKLRAGRREEAVADFEAALRASPHYAEAKRNLQAIQNPDTKGGH